MGAPEPFSHLVRPPHGSVLQYDLTEVAGLDFLSSPSGAIREAQDLAAAAFGADRTWFLVNGCSVGIHAAVMAVTGAASEAAAEAEGPQGGGLAAAGAEAAAEGAAAGPDPRVGGPGGGGGVLLVARNCHLSAFSAMVLAGCEPHWLQPEVDPRVGVAHCVTPGAVRAALERVAQAGGRRPVGVMVVSPTYFGAVADIEGIAAACHEHDVPLLVDEAHGGHFAFLPEPGLEPGSLSVPESVPERSSQPTETADQPDWVGAPEHAHADTHIQGQAQHQRQSSVAARDVSRLPLPPCPCRPPAALACGADLVIQSTHKVLGAMTQAAMLHVRGRRVSASRLSRALQTLQSSSPSYLLLASLDAARSQAAAGGAFDEPLAAARIIRDAVSRCRLLDLLDERTAGSRSSVLCFDPLRLTLLTDRLGLPGGGFGAAGWLERRHGVVPELATAKTVVLALGPGSTRQHAAVAAAAIEELDREAQAAAQGGAAAGEAAAGARPAGSADGTDVSSAATGGSHRLQSPPADAVEVVMTPRAAFFSDTVSVPAEEAVGRVSAELLCPYPPGVPLVFPGERITGAALGALRDTLAGGGAVTGAGDASLRSLQVVALGARPGEGV